MKQSTNQRTRSGRSLGMLLACVVLLCAGPMLAGCGGYAIKGRVIRGPVASVQVVSRDDARLTEPNATGGGASVSAVLEPDTPTERRDLGKHLADEQGWFAIPVDAFGSGFLEYEARLLARRRGNQGAVGKVPLPGKRQRVLITMPLGADTLEAPSRLRDEVLRDAEPYLRDER